MGLLSKRITITVEDKINKGIQGDLSAHCIALGLNVAWVFCILYGFGSPEQASTVSDFTFRTTFLTCFAAAMICAAITDQRFLPIYTAKRFAVVATILASCGTILLKVSGTFGNPLIIYSAALLSALGSAVLVLFIGIAFSRENTATIFFNSMIAIVISITVYILIGRFISTDLQLVAAALLPVIELPLLWLLTPESYVVRHAVPIFNPLPVKKPGFMLHLAPPALLFGAVLGAFRTASLNTALEQSPLTLLPFVLTVGTVISLVFMMVSFSVGASSSWNDLLRPIVPFVAFAALFIPSIDPNGSIVPSSIVLAGMLALASTLWAYFGQLSQEFRLSPIFVFAVAEAFMSIGLLAESIFIHLELSSLLPAIDHITYPAILIFMLLLGYSLMPSIQDIKRMFLPSKRANNSLIAQINDRNEQHIAPDNPAEDDRATDSPQTTLLEPERAHVLYESNKGSDQASEASEKPLPLNNLDSFFAEVKNDTRDGERKTGWFTNRCEEIANCYLLSRRETEVLFFLAKNYNASYIQEKLCVSRSTVKTHIAHIYRKLDIHTQNELIHMVEEGREKHDA